MKKIILAAWLSGVASVASAQGIPVTGGPSLGFGLEQLAQVQNVVAEKTSAATDTTGLEGLRSLQQQLHTMEQQFMQLKMMAQQAKVTGATMCHYEDKAYSEGAILKVGKVPLVCVERDWGVNPLGERQLVWEPVVSNRLEAYRRVTRLTSAR